MSLNLLTSDVYRLLTTRSVVLANESDAHQPRQREAIHKHDRFGAAFGTAAREQHDCAALMGLRIRRRGVGMAAAGVWSQQCML